MPYLGHRIALPMIVAMILVASTTGITQAQFPQARSNRTFTPNRPTMPAELDYFRRDVGALDPFNTFIRPRRELNQVLQQQQQSLNYLQQQQAQQRRMETQSISPTGVGARFFNFSHFYPGFDNRR
jgi:hypothetical protein